MEKQARPLDPAVLDNLVRELDRDTVLRLIDPFLTELRGRAASIRAAARAGDLSALIFQAHAVKATAASYGASGLSEAAERLELACRRGARESALDQAARLPGLIEGTVSAVRGWRDLA